MQLMMLDMKNHLEYHGVIDSRKLCEEMHINVSQLRVKLQHNKLVYKDRYAIIENEFEDDSNEEVSMLFKESEKKYLYYITNYGRVYSVDKRNGEKKDRPKSINNRGDAAVRANGKTYIVKNLVAKYFVKGWQEGCVVRTKDGNKENLFYKNLEIEAFKDHAKKMQNDRVQIPVKVYKRKKLVGEFKSIKEAAKFVGVDRSHLSKIIKGVNKNHTGYRFVTK